MRGASTGCTHINNNNNSHRGEREKTTKKSICCASLKFWRMIFRGFISASFIIYARTKKESLFFGVARQYIEVLITSTRVKLRNCRTAVGKTTTKKKRFYFWSFISYLWFHCKRGKFNYSKSVLPTTEILCWKKKKKFNCLAIIEALHLMKIWILEILIIYMTNSQTQIIWISDYL